jgi:ubiquitin-protein ligase
MSAVRLRRLQADYRKLSDYVRRHPRLQLIQTAGDPPERYQIEFQIRGLRQKGDQLVEIKSHLVEIILPLNYPRMAPQCRMLTPVFHPNIAPHAICIGDHWSPGEPLASIVQRIGEMLAFQSYNTKSPLNGEAARWASTNLDRLPLDPVSMLIDDLPAAPEAGAPADGTALTRPAASPAEAEAPGDAPALTRPADDLSEAAAPDGAPALTPGAPGPPFSQGKKVPAEEAASVACSACGHRLRANPALVGKKIRCPKCQTVQRYPGA